MCAGMDIGKILDLGGEVSKCPFVTPADTYVSRAKCAMSQSYSCPFPHLASFIA